jgi:hypothetical protein
MRGLHAAAVLLGAVVMATAVVVRAQQNPIPETFTNLQVLPKDITRAQLVPIMRNFAQHLGVRCEHCHVGEGNDLSKFDFASDARPAKAVARRMITMVGTINGTLLTSVGTPPPAGTTRVTCYTCHRGAKTPLTAPPG